MKILKAWGSIVRCWAEWKGCGGKQSPVHSLDEPTRYSSAQGCYQPRRLRVLRGGWRVSVRSAKQLQERLCAIRNDCKDRELSRQILGIQPPCPWIGSVVELKVAERVIVGFIWSTKRP